MDYYHIGHILYLLYMQLPLETMVLWIFGVVKNGTISWDGILLTFNLSTSYSFELLKPFISKFFSFKWLKLQCSKEFPSQKSQSY